MTKIKEFLLDLLMDLIAWPTLFVFMTGAMILALLEDRDAIRRKRTKITKVEDYPIVRNADSRQ